MSDVLPMCPFMDGFPVKVLARTATGVAFRCPQHGVCGLRYDSMSQAEALVLKVPYDDWASGGGGVRLVAGELDQRATKEPE